MTWNLPAETRLDELVRDWLDDLRGQLDPDTADLYRLHWATHLIPFFGQAQAITTQSVGAYCRARLKRVKRSTLQKERSTLRGFLAWCQELGHLSAVIELPALPKRAAGTAGEGLTGAAIALLACAASGEPVDSDALRDFAVASLLSPDAGPELCRLVHGVLSGGGHAPRRAIELCRLILAQARAERALLTEGSL